MNKEQLIKTVAVDTGLGKEDAKLAVEATFTAITEALKANEKVGIVGFGTFDTKHVLESEKRNPSNQEKVTVAEHYKPTFKYAGTFADQIKGKA